MLFEVDREDGEHSKDHQEVSNYVAATRYGLDRLGTLPGSLRLIREIHERLMRGVRGEDKTHGEFRKRQNMIGRKGQKPAQARFVPPPVDEMTKALHDLEHFIGHPTGMPVLIELALIHYEFETIHPFLDGNGRLGRLLINLLLCERGCLMQPLLYTSAYFYINNNQYMYNLIQVSQRGDWMPWLEFFLESVAVQSRTAINRSREILSLRERNKAKWIEQSSSTVPSKLIDMLIERPAVTITSVKHSLNVSLRAAQMNVDILLTHKTLVEDTGKRRNRVYLAPDIIRVIETNDDES